MKKALTTSLRTYRMDRRRISFLKSILEAYDNVAVLTTLDARQGLVKMIVAPGCEEVVDSIVVSLSDDLEIVAAKEDERI